MTSSMVQVETGGSDPGRLTSFYAALFDWRVQPAAPESWLVHTGYGDPPTPTDVTVYVAVEDLRTMLDRASALGGKTLVEPVDIPGVGRFALFTDPDGNPTGLLRRASDETQD